MFRNKAYIYILSAVCLTAIIGITIWAISGKGEASSGGNSPQLPELNRTITNSDSEIEDLEALDRRMNRYMRTWAFKGMSLAIVRNDSLVYAKGYGWADEEEGISMEPGNIMRVASVSKLLTAAGIMVLQDRGLLNIKDTVFGPAGILKDSLFTKTIKDRNYYKITIEHLLRHQGGFYRDPVFSSRDVKHQMGLDSAPEKEDFYHLVLKRRLRFAPGTWQKYSNFGYILLSNIIDGVMLDDYSVKFSGHTFECLDKGFAKNEPVDVVVRPEDVDVVPVDKGMLVGVVTSVTFKGVHYEIIVDIKGFKWMIQSTDYVSPEQTIGVYVEPDAIHIMKKSEYSNMFGDYSTFSDEMDHLSDIIEEEEE